MVKSIYASRCLHIIMLGFACIVTVGMYVPAYGAIIVNGAVKIGPEQQTMLEASKYVMTHQYREAEALYSQVIATNNQFIDAYLQRSVVRREMGNALGATADATMAIRIADMQIRQNPQAPKLYYQRGTGYRFLRNFKQARADIDQAIRLNNNGPRWKSDLAAMALEEKIGQ